MRVLAVDPGEARLGLALSDPTRTIARPLEVILHVSRDRDARRIVEIARREQADTVVVGVALDQEGRAGPQARRAQRLADAIRAAGFSRVESWDESGSTVAARRGAGSDPNLDARAAAVFLQDYLNASSPA